MAAVLLTDAGNSFGGVRIDTASGTGLCAEHSAIAAMVTAGEYRIAAIAAVWQDEQRRPYVVCRRAGDAESSSGRSTRATSTPSLCSDASAKRYCVTCCRSMSGRSLNRNSSGRLIEAPSSARWEDGEGGDWPGP